MKTIALAFAVGLALPAVVSAQPAPGPTGLLFETPEGCRWVDQPDKVQELWCKGADGRMRPTDTIRRDYADPTNNGCPRGYLDSGRGCAREGRVAAAQAPRDPPPPSPGPAVAGQQQPPQVYVYTDGRGRARRAYVTQEIPGSNGVTVMQRVPTR